MEIEVQESNNWNLGTDLKQDIILMMIEDSKQECILKGDQNENKTN